MNSSGVEEFLASQGITASPIRNNDDDGGVLPLSNVPDNDDNEEDEEEADTTADPNDLVSVVSGLPDASLSFMLSDHYAGDKSGSTRLPQRISDG